MEVAVVLSDPPEGAASLAAIDLGVDDKRRCRHCGAGGVVSRGTARGSSPCPVQGLWEEVRCADRHSAVGPAPQGALAGLWRRARRRAGATAFWRRCARRRAGLPGSSRLTRPSFSRAARGSGSWTARRAGAAGRPANPASRAPGPILVAADRAGETLSHTLPALNVDSVKEGLEPVVAPDALLVSDANRCYPPVAAVLDIPHESINASASQRVRGAAHPDGQ